MPAPPPKRRKVAPAKQPAPVEEINFDLNARHEYLTGFHKRKLQRAKHAQEVAERKAKEERKAQKKKVREERQSEFHKAMTEHRKRMEELKNSNESELGSQNGSATDDNVDDQEEEWDGFADPPPVDYEDEYIDEDKHTTVTVEEVDLSRVDGLAGLMGRDNDDHVRDSVVKNGQDADGDEQPRQGDKAKDKTRTRTGKDTNGSRKKKKKFTYESKAERKLARLKERQGNKKRAKARRSKS